MIVLHTTKYGESSLIVHVYSPEHGRTGLLLRGAARSRSSRNNLRLLHPLSILDVTLVSGRRQSDLLAVKEFNQQEPLTNLRTDLRNLVFDKGVCQFRRGDTLHIFGTHIVAHINTLQINMS